MATAVLFLVLFVEEKKERRGRELVAADEKGGGLGFWGGRSWGFKGGEERRGSADVGHERTRTPLV